MAAPINYTELKRIRGAGEDDDENGDNDWSDNEATLIDVVSSSTVITKFNGN